MVNLQDAQALNTYKLFLINNIGVNILKFLPIKLLWIFAGLLLLCSCSGLAEQKQTDSPESAVAPVSTDTIQTPSGTIQNSQPAETNDKTLAKTPAALVKQAPAKDGVAETKTSTDIPATVAEPPLHENWDRLLQRFVSQAGKVNYKEFKEAGKDLDAYLETLADHPPQADWSRADKMAYWINAYNAFTIKLITDHYPVKSIMDIHKGKPWDVKWIQLGGAAYSLNQIENEILRPQYQDARIHFALNCAARSCPPLYNRAYTASNLERSLDQRTRQFINDQNFNKIEASQVSVSKIFEWYSGDFGALIPFVNKYAHSPADASAKIAYLEYDWSLNEQ